jgi:hypothetical protein
MKTFQQFAVALHESPIVTLAKMLRLAVRPGYPEEGDAAWNAAQRYAKKINYPLSMNRETWNTIFSQADSEEAREKAQRKAGFDVHPNDQFIVDIRKAALRHGFDNSDSANYIIHLDQGYLGMIFHHKKYFHLVLIVPMQHHYQKNVEIKPFWVLKHEFSSQENLGKGDTVQTFDQLMGHLDLAKVDADAQAAKAERERPRHDEETPAQREVTEVLTKHGYTLEPAMQALQNHRVWNSADRQYVVYVWKDGSWDPSARVGGSLKSLLRRSSKPRTSADLDAFLNKLHSTGAAEPKAHANPEMDKILKFLGKNGFKKIEMTVSSATQYFDNEGVGLRVSVGRSDIMARGRITKDEQIYWSIGPYLGRNKSSIRNFKPIYGNTYEDFLKNINELAKFENGTEAILQLVKEFGFAPMSIDKVADKFRDSAYSWYSCGERTLSRGTVLFYYLGVHKTTGHYKYIQRGMLKEDWLELEGVDAATLKARLIRDGFKPGEHHSATEEKDAEVKSKIDQIIAVATTGGFAHSGVVHAELLMVHKTNHLYSLTISHKTAEWMLMMSNPALDHSDRDFIKVIAKGTDPGDLTKAIQEHISSVKTLPEAIMMVKVAAGFGFKLDEAYSKLSDDFYMDHKDTSALEINKETAGWQHFWKKKVVGSGMTIGDLKAHLQSMYNE